MAGWEAMSRCVEACSNLTSLNGYDGVAALRVGLLTDIDIAERPLLAVGLAPLILRSASTLTSLDLR